MERKALELEKEANERLAKNRNDIEAYRLKAKACWHRKQQNEAFKYAKKGIPTDAESGAPQVAREPNGDADFLFAQILSFMYESESNWDKAIENLELYAPHIPAAADRRILYDLLVHRLEFMKEKKAMTEKAAQELLESEQKINEENEKKNEKKKKKAGTSLSEAKEEKKFVESEQEMEACSREGKEENKGVESEPVIEALSSTEAKEEKESKKTNADQGGGVSRTMVFDIFMKKKYDIFTGFMGSPPYGEECCFIPATQMQLVHYTDLKELGDLHSRILSVQQRILWSDETYLVVDKVEPIDMFFEKLMKSVTTKFDKSEWWTMISDLFKRVFSDVIEGLEFLYSNDEVCGDLSFGLYITPKGRAKILPAMNRKGTRINDFRQLIAKMNGIIGLPFRMSNVVKDPEFHLPPSLISFLSDFHPTDDVLVPWILKAPFFWTMKEELKFLDGLSGLIQTNQNVKSEFEVELLNSETYNKFVWPTVLNGRYLEVWSKGDQNKQFIGPLPFGCFRVYPYKTCCDIFRYLCAVKRHINEKEYKTPPSMENYSQEKIANDIKGFYPTLYSVSHMIIYNILRDVPELLEQFMNIW